MDSINVDTERLKFYASKNKGKKKKKHKYKKNVNKKHKLTKKTRQNDCLSVEMCRFYRTSIE